jgi:hypothetical protein
MTPQQEKAKELVEKYAIWSWNETVCNYEVAKQCALIAVDEIMKLPHLSYNHNKDESQYDFWQEVKTEITKR